MKLEVLTKTKTEEIIFKLFEAMKTIPIKFGKDAGMPHMDVWEWPEGVGIFGLYLYYKESGNKEIFNYLINWFEDQIKKGLPHKTVNTMCPMLTLTYIYEETGNEKYFELCKEWLDYAMNGLPRTEEEGMQHYVGPNNINEQQLWDDTLYMTVLFVTRMGVLLKDDRYIQESIKQFMIHLKYLTDVKTGLLFHGWTFCGRHHFANALWARGNSWYTAGVVDYLDMVDIPQGVKDYLISSLEQQVRKLAELQTPEGMWHTLLDHPDSYVEASATAAFGYGILKAVRKGYIGEKYRETGMKALKAVISYIGEDGVLGQVSYGTGVGESLEDYKVIPLTSELYGQSMALLLLVEALKHK